ncbi:MAG: NAD(P)/FAD-dependent oxidoreductase [Marinibacterium sp.]|nr:NAD(P)/FAD-dependent oxidoreductase [Marinibacterium sp.]
MKDASSQGSLDHITQPLDVLIVGAGISGIAAASYLRMHRPDDRFAIVDLMDSFGGTWKTHTYPGIRSDSDLYTFGYSFKPWTGKPIATGAEILDYLGETIAENGLAEHIHYGWRVLSASWSTPDALWTLTLQDVASGREQRLSTRFLWMCQGYYDHKQGYTPDWDGIDDFQGEIIHPQTWPADFDGTGKHMTVIGSGATAATLVPNVADMVDHVTMLQRSPTYFLALPNVEDTADFLRKLDVPEAWVHDIARRNILYNLEAFRKRCVEDPDTVKAELIGDLRRLVGDDYDLDTHFTPSYPPGRQRIARISDGDMFRVVADGQASVVTDRIDRFVPEGIKLQSGEVLKTDVVVTATGFELCAFGDVAFDIDGAPLDFHDTVGYRSMMFTGVPNMVWIMGYFRASWTLRAELIASFVMRLLDHMEQTNKRSVEPQLRPQDQDMPILDWADEADFNPGYLLRGQHKLPKRGTTSDWKLQQDYWVEKPEFDAIDLTDPVFRYG